MGAANTLANGNRFTVAAVSPRAITLTDVRRRVELPGRGTLRLDHAYATTVHNSLGTTADRILIEASTTSTTTTKDAFYVSISRAQCGPGAARPREHGEDALANRISRLT